MEEDLKKRLIGATVLVSLAVIFIPMLLQPDPVIETGITKSNIPPMPTDRFSSRIIPLESEKPKEVVAEVKTEEPKPKPVPITTKPAETPQEDAKPKLMHSAWVIQVGSFSSRENADKLTAELRKAKYPAFVDPAEINGKTLFRVQVGPEVSRDKATATLDKINRLLVDKKLKGTLKSYP